MTSFNYVTRFFQRDNNPPSFMDDVNNEFSMSYTKRVMIFTGLLITGIVFCFLSTWMILSPRKFAKFYTIGTMCILGSTFFLVGPKRQLQSMFHPSRLMSAVLYIASMVGTLYGALVLQATGLTLLMVIVQFGAAIWYGASYVPFAQNCLRSTAKTVLPL